MTNFGDLFSELYIQEQNSYDARLSRAKVSSYAVARERMVPFLSRANDDAEVQLRIDLADDALRALAASAAGQYEVDADVVLSHIKERLAAEVAVTKPKTVDPEKGIGGEEGKKYLETRPRKVPEEGMPDDKTDVNELDAVMEEPKRHKSLHDQNLETQKDDKPGSGTGSSDSKSFPNHASVKEADGRPVGFRPGGDHLQYTDTPTVGQFVEWLRMSADPQENLENVAGDLIEAFMSEYQSAPEQFEDY